MAASHSALRLVLRVRRDDSASPQALLSAATVTAIVAVDSPINRPECLCELVCQSKVRIRARPPPLLSCAMAWFYPIFTGSSKDNFKTQSCSSFLVKSSCPCDGVCTPTTTVAASACRRAARMAAARDGYSNSVC